MRRRGISILLLVSFLISACGYKTFTFSGESDHWAAELKVAQTEDEYEEQELKLQYIGNDANSVGKINFAVDTNSGGFDGNGFTLEGNGTLIAKNQSNPTNAKIIKESEVAVTIESNGQTETIILKIK